MKDNLQILTGNCLEVLKTLPNKSVQTCVTSPPYWGLRDYNIKGQIGLESSLDEFIQVMVDVFKEVHRVLKDDGTVWLNLGDGYANSGCGWGGGSFSEKREQSKKINGENFKNRRPKFSSNLKPKDIIGIPFRVAFALQADGWYLRQDIIWQKNNPMPESVKDRCTKSHEYIFLLTKKEKYYFDQEAILEPCSENTNARLSQDVMKQIGSDRANGGKKTNGNMKAVSRKQKVPSGWHASKDYKDQDPRYKKSSPKVKDNESFNSALAIPPTMRNKRSVWKVPTKGFKEAHFATYPPKLIEPCILAGSKEGDIVLDPFNVAGTTGLVALENRRKYIGIELNPEYVEITNNRLKGFQIKML